MLMVYITFASAFLLIALGLTQISFRIYSKELYDKSLQELDYFSQNVNRGLKDAERNNYSISMDALVQRTLSDLSVLEYPSLDYNQKIRDLRRILLNEYDPESCVKSIIFVDLYGNTVEVGTAAWDVSGESFTAIKKQMEQGKGAYTTYGPTEECPYLLSGRVVRNRLDMSLSDMGKLIFVCDVGNVISENKESLSSNKAAIYVYNKNCAIYEDENIKKLDDLPKYVEHSGYKILKQSGRKYFVSYLYSAKTDWTYVSFFPYSDIYGQVQTVRTLLILGFLAVFTALVFFMKKLSVVIVSPLEHLTDSMQIVENGDFQGAREMLTNTDRQDEIGTLSREFTANQATQFSDIVIEKNSFINNSFGAVSIKQWNGSGNQYGKNPGWANRSRAGGAPDYADSNWKPHSNIVIQDNYINQGASAYACNGIYLTSSKDSVIQRNLLEHIGTCGIELYFTDNVAVQYNEISDVVKKGGGADDNAIDPDWRARILK